ncbi:integrase [Pseudomonas putida]|uniref:integrase n=1 Tax=Pseudomonas putida TaxID=303 RepID=UPI0039E0FE4D
MGEAVFWKGEVGLFIVAGYDAEIDKYEIRSSVFLGKTHWVTKSELAKITDSASEEIRKQSIENAEKADEKQERPVSHYTPEQIIEARRRERYIKPLSELDKPTKEDKLAACKSLNLGMTVVNELLNKYRQWPNWESLVPGTPGRRKGETRLEDDTEDIILEAIEKDYKGPGATVAVVIEGVKARCEKRGIKTPSNATIRRRFEEYPARKKVAATQGAVVARDIFSSFPYGAKTEHALDLCEADNSPLDCYAIDPDTGRVLGRPTLTLIYENHTQSYMGFGLSFSAPSRNTFANALFMAIQPKDELLAEFGLSEKFRWIQYGVGAAYRVDGGSDFNALTVVAGLGKNGIWHERRTRPQSGGKVERAIGKLNRRFIQTLNGAIASHRKLARGEDPEGLAELDITDLYILIIMHICAWHERAGSDGFTPNQRWIRSYSVKDGLVRVPPTLKDPLQFKIDLLHEHRVTVAREGIRVVDLFYEPGPYWNKVGTPVRVKLDYMNLHRAWVEHDSMWKEIELKNSDLIPKTMYEWQLIRHSGMPKGEYTRRGLKYLAELLATKSASRQTRAKRRLEESGQLQERVERAAGVKPASKSSPTPAQKRGPAPPMMGDDDQ